MTQEQYLKNLNRPQGPVDVVLDTDAFNEIDDQFAISYLLRYGDKLRLKGICAAPFLNKKVESPREGMRKSFDEITKLLKLAQREELSTIVHRGSEEFLPDEATPVPSDAASFMAELADTYTPENPLYIIAIGAITDVASAILKNPRMKENCVIIWLGGHGIHMPEQAAEFNMVQDIAAARVVMGCGIPMVLVPCRGVVDRFCTSKYELAHWLKDKNSLANYLYENACREAESYAAGKPWTRTIWDVTAVAWLLNEDQRYMRETIIPAPVPEYDKTYSFPVDRHPVQYVFWINRDALFEDLFRKLTEK